MYPVNTPARDTRSRIFPATARAIIKLAALCLVAAAIPVALYVRVDSKAAKPLLTVQAAGRGKPYFNFQDGREARLDFRGEQHLTQALLANQAQPRSLASTTLRHAAVPDLIAGYAYNGMGIVTVQYGNPDAFAPSDESVYARMQQGYNPDSLLPGADTYLVPESPDFLQVGDFNHDNRKDVLIAGRAGNLFLLPGDGLGKLNAPEQIFLPGRVTALTAGEFRAADGWTDVAIGVETPNGPALLIYDGDTGLSGEPMSFQLSAPATSIQITGLDNDPFMDVAVAAGSEVNVIHGWGRKQEVSLESRRERINLNNNARELAAGYFIWNRAGNHQIAVLSDDGTVNVLDQAGSDSRPFTIKETAQKRLSRRIVQKQQPVDVEAIVGWQASNAASWNSAREFSAGSSLASAPASQSLLQRSHVSFHETDDLLMLNGNQNKVDLVRQVDSSSATQSQSLSTQGDLTTISLDASEAPVAVLALPQKLNGQRNLVMLQQGSSSLILVPLAPTALPVVDLFTDPAVTTAGVGAAACTGAAGDCSLRGAVLVANANPGSTITIPSGTVVLSINGTGTGGCDGPTVGDLGVNQATTINGAGAGSTFIRQSGTGPAANGDRVMCMNELFLENLAYSFSGFTVHGGRDSGGLGGGGIIGGEKGNSLVLSGVTISNNQVTGGNIGGGGIQITGGNLTVTNSTIGGTLAPVLGDRTTVARGNINNTSTAGGLYFTPSAPTHTASTGNLVVTGTTISNNHAFGTGGGGATSEIFAMAAPGGIGTGTATYDSTTFNANQASNGGGLLVSTLPTTLGSVAGTVSFTSNTATAFGGGVHVGGGSLHINGTLATINFAASNTAPGAAPNFLGGSSVSANGPLTLSGTQTTIGGTAAVFTNGTWTNNAGSAMSPTDFAIVGGTLNCNNSTINVTGNFSIGPEATKGGILNADSSTINIQGNLNVNLNNGGSGAVGQFNAGTGTFNFNGSAAQSITNVSAFNFFNLTDSNVTQPLTANNSFGVGGTLNVNGPNAIFSPVAAAAISGAGTLTGTGTARVTRTGADSFFLQYPITTKTLTNLTVEYIGAGAQTASTTTYGNLKITNGSGVTLNAGNTIVNGTLILQTGALAVSTNTLTINNGITVGTGSLNSAATGTVNYNQSSAGQSVLAANYGNLTFSAFTKVLPSSGTVGVAGTFNPNGITTGHTITGSTFDFNGTGAQTVPVFNFNNLIFSGARGGQTVTLAAGTIGVAGTFNHTATGVVYGIAGNTFDFNGAGAQTITAFNYNNLTISGARAVAITLGNSTVGVAGVFNPSITGNTWTANPSNTMSFNGSVLQTIPAFAFFNGLTLANPAGANLGGNVTVLNALALNAGALGVVTHTLTLNGAASFGAGTLTSSPTGTVIYNQQSNGQANVLAGTYGNLTFSNFNKTLAPSGTIAIAGTFTPGSATGHTITGSTINFNGAGAQSIPGFTYNNLTSSGGGVARTLDPVNTIKIAGLFTPGPDLYTITGSTIEYNGGAAQTLPAAFLTYNNVTFNNPTTVTGGPATLDVNGNLTILQGTFAAGGSLAITVGGNWTNNGGAFSPSTGDVTFDGGAGQAIGGTTATTFNHLSVGNASGLAMNNDNTVNGALALVGSDITVAATRTLTQPVGGSSSGAFDVNGRVQRTGLVTGACPVAPCANTRSFGNPNNQITLTAGAAPANIVVNLVRTVPTGFANAVQRTYTITPSASGFTGTLRLRYLESELNSNVEGANFIFRRFNGVGWAPVAPTTSDFVNNWLEKTGQAEFSPWTFGSVFSPTAAGGTVSGRIVDDNGAPVEGAVVRLSGTQNRKFITDANGVYRFEQVETSGFYTVTPTRANYTFSPASRDFSQIGETTEAAFAANAASSGFVNPLDTPEYFVRQNYLDFLGREPDEAGFNFWSDQILACGGDAECVDSKRTHVSAAYFLSIEFQETGGLVDGLYRASFGRRPSYSEFKPDAAAVAPGLVVNSDGWQTALENGKTAFVDAFVQRAGFQTVYGSLSNDAYVDALIANTGVSFTSTERNALVSGLGGGMTRAAVLRQIVEDADFVSAKRNSAFVMMEYFGYLRREPDAAGFDFWLGKLNQFNGNFEQAEMVRSFIISGEYRDRFPK